MRIFLIVSLAFWSLLPTSAIVAASDRSQPVGIVAYYTGASTDYEFVRGSQRLSTRYYMPVFNGDKVRARSSTGKLILSLSDGTSLVVSSDSGWVTIQVTSVEGPSSISAWLTLIGEKLSRHQDRGAVSLVTRGPDDPLALTIEGLTAGSAQVGAGPRMFGVAWWGQSAPFHVVVRDSAGTLILDEANVLALEVVKSSRMIDLKQGRYSIELWDSNGTVARGSFRVIPPDAIPKPPSDLAPAFADASVRQIAAALWLAEQGNGQFAYEAYLRLLPLLRDNRQRPDIELLLRSLRNGARL